MKRNWVGLILFVIPCSLAAQDTKECLPNQPMGDFKDIPQLIEATKKFIEKNSALGALLVEVEVHKKKLIFESNFLLPDLLRADLQRAVENSPVVNLVVDLFTAKGTNEAALDCGRN